MDLILSHENFFLATWFGLLFLIEKLNKYYLVCFTKKNSIRWLKNGLFGVINRFIGPMAMLPIVMWATDVHLWVRPTFVPTWLMICVDIIILDLMNYWFHRMSHAWPLLWRFHEIHHLDSNFDSTTGLRIHFGEVFLQHIFRSIPIILLSIPLQSVLIFEFVLIIGGLFHHSNLHIPNYLDNFFSKFIVMPDRHCVHHHSRYTDWNSNFGFIFIWWDKLFSTFNTAERKPTWHIGLGYAPDLDVIHLLISPFILKKLRHRMKEKKCVLMRNSAEKTL